MFRRLSFSCNFFHSLLLILLFVVFYLLLASPSIGAPLSGSLSLPPSTAAGSGGVRFTISTQPSLGVQSTISIPAFQNSVGYSLTLPNGANYRVKFDCVSGCELLNTTTTGLWSADDGVVARLSDATSYSSSQTQVVNLRLEEADVFSGFVNFPEGFQATGAEAITVSVIGASFAANAIFTQTIQPQADQSSWAFVVGVPPDETLGGWNMQLRCVDCNPGLASEPHFPTEVLGDPASLSINQQFFYLKNRDNPNIVVTFISNVRPEATGDSALAPIYLLLGDD